MTTEEWFRYEAMYRAAARAFGSARLMFEFQFGSDAPSCGHERAKPDRRSPPLKAVRSDERP
jgi:hypothetical protein